MTETVVPAALSTEVVTDVAGAVAAGFAVVIDPFPAATLVAVTVPVVATLDATATAGVVTVTFVVGVVPTTVIASERAPMTPDFSRKMCTSPLLCVSTRTSPATLGLDMSVEPKT